MAVQKLSSTMKMALKLISAWGGSVHRWPGGFWIGEEWATRSSLTDKNWSDTPYLGTQTVRALADRGLLEVTGRECKSEGAGFSGFIIKYTLSANDPTVLELLIDEYETAVFSLVYDGDNIDRLCYAVEQEATRIGYENPARLHALHTAAEQRSNLCEENV